MSLQPNSTDTETAATNATPKLAPPAEIAVLTESNKPEKDRFWQGFFLGIVFILMVGFGICMVFM